MKGITLIPIAILLMVLFPMLLIGCSHISTPSFLQYRDKHYLSARSIQPLKIPPGVSSSAFHNDYPVSDRNYPESAKQVTVVPSGLQS